MDDDRAALVRALTASAERLDELAEVAALMDDEAGALALRHRAERERAEALDLLDRG